MALLIRAIGRGTALGSLLLLAIVAAPSRSSAIDVPGNASLEYDVKAAFLLNFVKFVQWPASAFREPTSPIVVCVLRHNPFGDTLGRIVEGESIGGRPVTIRRISTTDQATECHVLFVPETARLEDGDAAVPRDPGLLTVGESEGFLRQGGIIAFFADGGRIRFWINPEAAEQRGLRVSARLLRVARVVHPPGSRP
jgi:hypothetical protein